MSGTGTGGHPYREPPQKDTSHPQMVEVDSNDVEATIYYQECELSVSAPLGYKSTLKTATRKFVGIYHERYIEENNGLHWFGCWLTNSQGRGMYAINNTTHIPAHLICRIDHKVIPTKLLAEVKKQR